MKKIFMILILCASVKSSIAMEAVIDQVQKEWSNKERSLYYSAGSSCLSVVQGFVELGAVIDAQHPENGNTALHVAAINGRVETISYLLSQGADQTIRNKLRRTALDVAHPSVRHLFNTPIAVHSLSDEASWDDAAHDSEDNASEQHENAQRQSDGAFKCSQCPYSTKSKYFFTAHEKAHRLENPLRCDLCAYITGVKESLIVHKRIHTGEKPFHCAKCDLRFAARSQFDRHVKSMHKAEEANTITKTPTPVIFELHQEILSNEEVLNVPSNLSDEALSAANDSEDNRSNRGENNQVEKQQLNCSQCGYSTRTLIHLTTHEKAHKLKNPFKCAMCYYITAKKGNLHLHEMTHSNENPFKCPQCSYMCKQRSRLAKHVATNHRPKVKDGANNTSREPRGIVGMPQAESSSKEPQAVNRTSFPSISQEGSVPAIRLPQPPAIPEKFKSNVAPLSRSLNETSEQQGLDRPRLNTNDIQIEFPGFSNGRVIVGNTGIAFPTTSANGKATGPNSRDVSSPQPAINQRQSMAVSGGSLPHDAQAVAVEQSAIVLRNVQLADLDYLDVRKQVNGKTLLHVFAQSGKSILESFLKRGADKDAQDLAGDTPLMLAVRAGKMDLVELYVDNGANVDKQNKAGETALIIAAKNGSMQIMTKLLNRGAKKELTDGAGKTFVDYLNSTLRNFIQMLI